MVMNIRDLSYQKLKEIFPADMMYNRHIYRRIISYLCKRHYKTIDKYRLLDIIRAKFPVYTHPSKEEFCFEYNREALYYVYASWDYRELIAWKCRNIRKWEPFC